MTRPKLPRLPDFKTLIFPRSGLPTETLRRWWDRVTSRLETAEGEIDDLQVAALPIRPPLQAETEFLAPPAPIAEHSDPLIPPTVPVECCDDLAPPAPWATLMPFDETLAALGDLNSTAGLLAQTGADAFTKRTLTGTANQITVTNGDGAAGNPTLSLPSPVTTPGALNVSGTVTVSAGLVQLDNARYYQGKIAAGTTTRMLGINASDACFVGSIDAAVTQINFSSGGSTWGSFTATALNLISGSSYRINSVQVVTSRRTGWSAMTGTAARGAAAAHAAQTITNPPTQAEVQNIDNSLVIVAQRLKALIDDLTTHGLIGT